LPQISNDSQPIYRVKHPYYATFIILGYLG
jgi:hypothetical protein